MFAAPPGIVARYRLVSGEPPNQRIHYTYRNVISFDSDGDAYVLPKPNKDDERPDGLLVRAAKYNNFVGLEQGKSPYVSLIPGNGYRVKWVDADNPLVGWALRADGKVVALDSDCDGGIIELGTGHSCNRIYHPESKALVDDTKARVNEEPE